jgi:ABC-type multidrug transport system fused ATPase/permease subunit
VVPEFNTAIFLAHSMRLFPLSWRMGSYLLWIALILLGPSMYFEESMMNRVNQQANDLKSAEALRTSSEEHADIAHAQNRSSLQDKAQGHALLQNATRASNRSQTEHLQSVQDYQLAKDYTSKAVNETEESKAYKSLAEALESKYENEI